MKHVFFASLVVVASAANANDLELQPGQWSINTKLIGNGLSGYSAKNEDTGISSTYTSNRFNLQGEGEYAVAENLKLGLYAWLDTSSKKSEDADSSTTHSKKTTDVAFTIQPSISYRLKDSLFAFGSVGLELDGADKVVDQDGLESYDTNKYNAVYANVGARYLDDIRSNILLDVKGMAGISSSNYIDPVDSSNTYQENYLKLTGIADARYFLANNLSVDFGVRLYYSKLLSEKDDGVDVDLGDNTYNALSYRTNIGFTYYHR
ncbi:MAG: hypothetical protein P8X89_05700 [Reinekea sp.]